MDGPQLLRRRLKFAHLFQSASVQFSLPQAAQLHIYHTIRGLQQAGHQVTLAALQPDRRVLCTDDLRVFQEGQLDPGWFGSLGPSGAKAFKALESIVRRAQVELQFPYLGLFDSFRMYDACRQNLQDYDLIHERYNLLALGGALASRRLGIPFILEVNADLIAQRKFKGTPVRGLYLRYAEWTTRYCFNTARRIICISSDLSDHLAKEWGVPANKLAVLPCAADTEAFAKPYPSEAIRKRLGLVGKRVVMWIGGFYAWHDLDMLVDSFHQIHQRVADASLVLVGDGEMRPLIEQRIAENGLGDAVLFTGSVAHTEIPKLLPIADVAVVPSVPVSAMNGGTGTPLKLFEYMAAGKPIVATAIGHSVEVLKNGYSGILVEPGDADKFAGAVAGLLTDPAERRRLGQNASRLAREKYSWKRYTGALEDIYFEAVSI